MMQNGVIYVTKKMTHELLSNVTYMLLEGLME
jgi:hypothetical protein